MDGDCARVETKGLYTPPPLAGGGVKNMYSELWDLGIQTLAILARGWSAMLKD